MSKELTRPPEDRMERYAKILKYGSGMNDVEAKKLADERADKIIEDRKERARLKSIEEVKSQTYIKDELQKSDENFKKVKAPDWLRTNTPETNEGKEFISRIAANPDDPSILHKEVARLYWSTSWTSLTDSGVKEIRGLIEDTLQHIEKVSLPNTEFSNVKSETLWNELNQRFDIYRTKRLEPLEEPERPPLKKQGDMNVPDIEKIMQEKGMTDDEARKYAQELRAKRVEWIKHTDQRTAADAVLKEYQDRLDKPTAQTLRLQDETLRDLQRELERGTKPRFDKNHQRLPTDYNKEDVDPIISKIQARRTEIEQTRDYQRQVEYANRKQVEQLEKQRERAEIAAIREEERKERHTFSSIYLSPEAFKAMMKNPKWKIEEMLRQIERTSILFPDTPAAEAATRQLQLMNEYIANAQYQSDVEEHIASKPVDDSGNLLFPDAAAEEAFRKRTYGSFEELSTKVSIRTSIHKAYGMIRGVGDPEKMWQSLLTVGEKGFENLLSDNGGLNEIAFNKYVTYYKLARFDEMGKLRRILPENITEIRNAVTNELKSEKELYKDLYKPAYGTELTDADCEAIVRQAEFAVVLSQQDLVAMLGALGPGEGGTFSSFLSTNTGEQMLAAMDIQRWFFDKWGNLTPGQRTIWENACRIAIESTGRGEYIEERLKEIQQGTPAQIRQAKEELSRVVFGIENPQDDKQVRDKLKDALEFDRKGHRRKDYPTKLEQVTLEQWRDKLKVAEGKKVVGELLEVYDHFSSSWRINTHLEQINRVYGYGDKLALGMRLRAKAYWYLHGEMKSQAQRDEIKADLIKQLKITGAYRPQALFEFLTNGKDERTFQWFDGKKGAWADSLGIPRDQFNRPDQLYKYVYPKFISINELLAKNDISPIDYSNPGTISVENHRLLARVLGRQRMAYLGVMKEISDYVNQDRNINELLTAKYDKIYYRTQWVDDARLRFLENPESAHSSSSPGSAIGTKGKGYSMALSEVFTEKGTSNVDPLVRTWRDGGLGAKTVQEIYAALTPDEKTLVEQLVKIKNNVATYSGHMAAFRADLFLLGGWAETFQTDRLKDLFMLTGLPGSSAGRRLFGEHAPSMGLNEIADVLEKNDAALLSKMELIAPETYKYIEEFLGIAKKDGVFKGTRLPLYLYRARIWVAVAALILTIEFGKTAEETMSEKKR